jgi:hypothetical protein
VKPVETMSPTGADSMVAIEIEDAA